jgi:hypothetical protein
MEAANLPVGHVWDLPPVILHPFTDPSGPDKLVESSRAHLMLQGLLPSGDLTREEILSRLLAGRMCEVRMLFYVGKDLDRWLDQCMEIAERDEDLRRAGVTQASFMHLLVEQTPQEMREKLIRWGVADYRAIFSRALGLNGIFATVPTLETVNPGFIRHYYRYADQLYQARLNLEPVKSLAAGQFRFELFASGEYSKLLETEWESAPSDEAE